MNTVKMDGQLFNTQEELLQLLQEQFPEVFSDGKVDAEKLKRTLGEKVETGSERYGLTWAGKSNCFREIQKTTTATLAPVPEQSVDFDTTKNLFIEGDNLEVLRVLQRSYYGKVKMIYIDPPYNTGNDFIYDDNFKQDRTEYEAASGQKNTNGDLLKDNALRRNTRDNGHYHSDWLNMLYPRLFLARNLLRRDGVIFVSIDDNEVANLRLIMDEIFGEENFIGQIAVQLNPRGRHLDKFIARTHEYILVYAKNVNSKITFGLEKGEEMLSEYNKSDENGKYRELELRNRNPAFNSQTRPNLYYPIYVNPLDGLVALKSDKNYTEEVFPKNSTGGDSCWTWSKTKFMKDVKLLIARKANGSGWRVFRKDYLIKDDGSIATTLPKSIWQDKDINNDYGKKAIQELFDGKTLFDFPKSPGLIKRLVQMCTNDNDVILDFFAGSATTAQAVFELNHEEETQRQFIMIQLPEQVDGEADENLLGFKNIADIAKERIRRVSKRINNSISETGSVVTLDLGFKVFKLKESNFAQWNGLISSAEQLSEQLSLAVENVNLNTEQINILSELILKSGLELTESVVSAEQNGVTYFIVGDNTLITCLGGVVTKEFIDYLEQLKPSKVIFLEKVFANNDDLKTNTILNLERANIDFKVI